MNRGPLPAWDLYDGVLFRVCKKAQREGRWPDDVDVRILSAEYRLIRPETVIAPYNRKLDKNTADVLRSAFLQGGSNSIPEALTGCREIYIAAGGLYRDAIRPNVPRDINVIDGSGEIGRMQQKLKAWLDTEKPCTQIDAFAA